MSRAIGGFVVFCLLLVAVLGWLVWWTGPNLLRLAFDAERADHPYQLLVLHSAEAGYEAAFDALLAVQQPAPRWLWRERGPAVVSGGRADEWAGLDVLSFDSGRAVARLATSPDFRQVGGLLRARVVVGARHPPEVLQPMPMQLWLFVGVPEQGALGAWLQGPASAGARIVWRSPVEVLAGHADSHGDWSQLLVVDFADHERGLSWMASPEARTALSLLESRTQSLNLWLLRPPPLAADT